MLPVRPLCPRERTLRMGADDLNVIRCDDGFSCYTALMTYNAISAIECLVEDFGWDAVMDVLMKEAASDERLNEVEELLDAAITVNEGKGQLFVLR